MKRGPRPFSHPLSSPASSSDQEIRSFRGYRSPLWKACLYWLIALLTGGLSLLACKWSTRLRIWLSLSPCALAEADHLLIKVWKVQQCGQDRLSLTECKVGPPSGKVWVVMILKEGRMLGG